MNLYRLKSTAENMGVSFKDAALCRFRYLREQMFIEQADIDHFTGLEDDSSVIIAMTALERFTDNCNEQRRIFTALKAKTTTGSRITDDQIDQARAVPIEQVVEFTRGVSVAFCHTDKSPSLYWNRKHNRAHCFPCGKSFNPIDVLIQRDGLSFVEAVQQLTY